jgi:hypothetical protein
MQNSSGKSLNLGKNKKSVPSSLMLGTDFATTHLQKIKTIRQLADNTKQTTLNFQVIEFAK